MHSSALCSRCEEEDETICHALIGCADSREMWLTSPFVSCINDAPVIPLLISSCGFTLMSPRRNYLICVLVYGPAGMVVIGGLWRTVCAM